MNLDEWIRARARTEEPTLPEDWEEWVERTLAQLPERKQRRMTGGGRRILTAAAVCAMLGVGALAYAVGVLDFLNGREEYRFLGQAELYREYARKAGYTQRAANGDELTVEYLAADANFCTIFYTMRTEEPMQPWSQRDWHPISPDAPDLWQAQNLAPRFTLEVSGAMVGEDQDGQQYLLDEHTLCGMARLTLKEAGALERGGEISLAAGPSLESWDSGDWGEIPWEEVELWHFSLDLEPMAGKTVALDGPAALGERQVEKLSLTVSPLGAVLRCRVTVPEEYQSEPDRWGGLGRFIVRDSERGVYYPYTILTSQPTEDGAYWEEAYLLCGDLTEIESLELLPAELESTFTSVELGELPYRGQGAYTFAGFSISEGWMTLTLTPTGTVGNTGYCGGVAEFQNRARERLFVDEDATDLYQNRYTDERTGGVTYTWSLDQEAQTKAEEIAVLRILEEWYEPLEGPSIIIPLASER